MAYNMEIRPEGRESVFYTHPSCDRTFALGSRPSCRHHALDLREVDTELFGSKNAASSDMDLSDRVVERSSRLAQARPARRGVRRKVVLAPGTSKPGPGPTVEASPSISGRPWID